MKLKNSKWVKVNDSSFIWRESSLSRHTNSTFMRPVSVASVSLLKTLSFNNNDDAKNAFVNLLVRMVIILFKGAVLSSSSHLYGPALKRLQHWRVSMTFRFRVSVRSGCYSTLTALIMLVWPDPGIQPVTTITMSPDFKNPLAFPEERNTGRCVSKITSG